MRWRKANRRRRERARKLSLHDWVTRMLYRLWRARGLNHEDALNWATPRYLYPVLTPIRNNLPRVKS